jgi:hypothetical protein
MQALEQNLEATLNQASIDFVKGSENHDEAVHAVSVSQGDETEALKHDSDSDDQQSPTQSDDKLPTESDNDSSQSH